MASIRTLITFFILCFHLAILCVAKSEKSAASMLLWLISKKIEKFSFQDVLNKLEKKGFSEECRDDIDYLEEQLMSVMKSGHTRELKSNLTIVKLLDASTKIPSGIMDGKLIWTGLLQECQDISQVIEKRRRPLEGKYCRVHVSIPNIGCASTVQEQIYKKPMLGIDVCIPKSCQHELQSVTDIDVPLTKVCNVKCMEDESRFDFGSYIVLGILAIFGVITLFGTTVDYYIVASNKQEHSTVIKNYWVECTLCFSLYTNIKEIFDTRIKPGQITMLNGVRAFTIGWVIAGHVLLIYLMMSDNPLVVQNIVHDFNMMWLVNAYFSVDTFFYISGFLTGFLFFKYAKNNKNYAFSLIRWIMYYVHRILRLSPAYYIVLAFHTWVTPEILRKSVLAFTYYPLDSCKQIWWRNFLYISNYKDLDDTCYISSWYLSTDFQIFAFAPIVLIAFSYHRIGGYIFSVILLTLSIIAQAVTIIIYHFPPSDAPGNSIPVDPEMTEPFSKYTLLVYDAPWIRFPPYLIGIMLGHFMQTTNRIRIPKYLNIIIFSLCLITMFVLVHILYHYFQGHLIPIIPRGIYSAVSKPLWAVCLSYITYACYHNYGGIVNKFLSLPIFIPIGRLSYSIYLLHMSILFWMGSLHGQRYVLSSWTQMIVTTYIPAFVLTSLSAILLCAVFEIGTGKLEAKLLGLNRHTDDTAKNDDQKTKRF